MSEKEFKVVDRRLKFDEADGKDGPGEEQEAQAAEEAAAEESGPQGSDKESSKGPETDTPLPKVSFSTFVLSLSSSALVHLGEVPEPESGEIRENMPMAKHSIDILAMLQEKTKNGLDPDETRLLEGLLYELRMKYVMKTK